MKPHIAYIHRGSVERGTGNGYQWRDGFSEAAENGAVTFPWMTARECQADAKKRGAVARFIHHTTTNKTKKKTP